MKDIIKSVRYSEKELKTVNKAINLLKRKEKELDFSLFVRRASLQDASTVLLAEGVDN